MASRPSRSAQPLSSRDKILDVAEALFARRGYSGVGLQQVAGDAGLRKSSLFHHFRSKAQLYFEVLGRVLGRLQGALAPALESADEPFEKLDRSLDAMIDALAEHPTTARLLLRALFEDDDLDDSIPEAQDCERVIGEVLQSLGDLLRDGVERGAFRRVSVPHTLQTLIGATVYHFASGELGEGLLGKPLLSSEAVARRKDEIRNLLHLGIAAPSAPAIGETP